MLQLKNISFHYQEKNPILKNINLEIHQGEMISIVGANGTGKSTFGKLLCGFEKPTSGTIEFNGIDVARDSIKERGERVGFVLQNPNHMFSKQLIYEEVAFGLLQKHLLHRK